jgi:hypothetical protein
MKKIFVFLVLVCFALSLTDFCFGQAAPAVKTETPAVKAEEKAPGQTEVKKAPAKSKKKKSKKKKTAKKRRAQKAKKTRASSPE